MSDRLEDAEGCMYWFSWAILFAGAAIATLGCVFGMVLMTWRG